MNNFSEEERVYISHLATALSSVEIADREMDDMRLLYKCTNGIAFEGLDNRNRPQGPTIKSSSTLGSKLKRSLGAPNSHYGMSFVGYCS